MAKPLVTLAKLLRLISIIQVVKNRLFNSLATMLTGQSVSVDWRDLKIIHPEKINIGPRFACGRSVWLESVDGLGSIDIAADVNLSDQVHVGALHLVRIGEGVLIGSRVLITDHSHGSRTSTRDFNFAIPPNQRPLSSKGPVSIGPRVWLGDGVCVLAGVSIGEESIVGANSVVVCNIPARTVWAGVPARQVWPSLENINE